MNKQKNDFLNLIFQQNQQTSNHQQEREHLQIIQNFVEENVFVPRNRLAHVRILKINDSIYTAKGNHSLTEHLKSIFVDGSHLAEFAKKRQLATQNCRRTILDERQLSPYSSPRTTKRKSMQQYLEEGQRNEDYFRLHQTEKLYDQKNIEQTSLEHFQQQSKQSPLRKIPRERNDEFLSLDNSTVSSSHKNIKKGVSVRYRKIIQTEKKDSPSPKLAFQLKKQLLKIYSNPFGNPQNITAKAYIVIEHFKQTKDQRTLHTALNSKINLQIASLTKIMTCILTIELCMKFKINIHSEQILIGTFETKIEGTVAELQIGQIYTVQQLLYGLMLPSGNDASLALSSFCGKLIEQSKQNKRLELNSELNFQKQCYQTFIREMNKKCLQLQMKRTFFSNTHGLCNPLNRSCASDTAILVDYALKNPLFRSIIATKQYQCDIYAKKKNPELYPHLSYPSQNKPKKVKWENTHRLIHTKPELYKGIKTGITSAAGPCLASLVQKANRQFIIIVLNSRSLKSRYKDTELLRQWLFKKQQFFQ